jgi:UPF0755 protein
MALVIGGVVAAYWFFGPYRGFQTQVFVDIDRGMSSREIANQLARRGVVRSPWVFLAVRAVHPRAALQAGEYRFAGGETPWQVFEKIRHGEIFYEEITVPEGSNIFDIAGILDGLDMVRGAAFLKAAARPQMIRDLDPAAPSLEGYLFPSTYRMTRHTTALALCRTMTDAFRAQWKAANPTGNSDVHRVVTLASLVEKESAAPGERPLIASVFMNRLRMAMPLQCDPTTVYAALLENRYRGTIYRSDLASANPYNTYTHAGLPPGPICNPGIQSLNAVLHPATTDFLYFVAKPDASRTHHFSATLAEHENAVQAYRRSEKPAQ